MIMRRIVAMFMLLAAMAPATSRAACVNCQSVAVVDIESEVNCNYFESFWGTFLVIECRKKFAELRTMVETAIVNTNKFSVFERARLYSLLDERALSQIRLTGGNAYRARLKGVDFLIFGKVTEFSRGSSSYAEQRFNMSSADAALALDLRIVNVRTGQIVYASNVREELQTDASVNTGINSRQTNMDTARTYGLLQRGVAQSIARELTIQGYPPTVAQTNGNQIYINYGTPFLQAGMTVDVLSLGAPIDDPTTGTQIGRIETPAGSYRVDQVASTYAIASLVSPGQAVAKRGDLVRFKPANPNGYQAFDRVELPRN